MKEDYEHKNSPDEVSHLLKTLIEVELRQHELLARLSHKLDTAICVLEHISKNTCETLNEAHEQTALQRALIECKELCSPPPPPKLLPCGEKHPPVDHQAHDCCKIDKPEPCCVYEPCIPSEEGGGSAVCLTGSVPPQRVFGAPFPAAEHEEKEEEEANEVPAPKVPRGPFRGFLVPGQAIKPLDFKSGGASGGDPDPVVFGKFTSYGKTAAPFSTTAADISGGESGSIVLATGIVRHLFDRRRNHLYHHRSDHRLR